MEILLDYLRKQNRPYGVTDLITNLHNSLSKPVTTKALAQLEAEGKVTCKTYSKSQIYVIKQDMSQPDEDGVGVREDEEQVKLLQSQVLEYSNQVRLLKERM